MTSPDDAALRARLLEAAELFRQVGEDRGMLAVLDEEERKELMILLGRVSRPDRNEVRKLLRALRKRERADERAKDEELLASTGIRSLRREAVFPTPQLPGDFEAPASRAFAAVDVPEGTDEYAAEFASEEPGESAASEATPHADPTRERGYRTLRQGRKCYVCKVYYHQLHPFYDLMCPPCAEHNFERRNATADLRGRVALLTGARVKIGYHAAIKLLRAGAHVIVTTRFPVDAAQRFAREPDYAEWRDRVEVFGLDLRHTPSIEAFCQHLLTTKDRLDFIINNACQTVRRPPGFYKHLIAGETHSDLSTEARRMLESYSALVAKSPGDGTAVEKRTALQNLGLLASASLSQVPLTAEDHRDEVHFFPEGKLDQDLQQVDLRERNSWRMALADVPTVELLEVQLVNAVAPFVLNARLKPLMLKVPTRDKHIVNVSAMEGQFYREHKTDKHPHTNMAKAALNMLTRTSAMDYIKDGIHMNSVDTGWITDEDPVELAARKQAVHGFHPPLDVVDGAARIVDPIMHGFATGQHVHGLFLKDYKPIPW